VSRTVALDIHKRFAEVAVHEDGRVRRVGRVEVDELERFAGSLRADDHVVIESTSQTWAVVELIGRQVGRVTVSHPMRTRAIASAKIKTDKIDARVLAQLGAADFLPPAGGRTPKPRSCVAASLIAPGWCASAPGCATRFMPSWRATWSPSTSPTGSAAKADACWLRWRLPGHEREQVDSALRLHDALDGEIGLAERTLAERALGDSGVQLLLSIPGVGPMTSLAIVSVIGEVGRFPSSRELVSYFGLDPRVRQSGDRAARHGHLSREGQAHARGLLVEAAHSAVRTPGPLRAFYQRIKTRRGTKTAICATAQAAHRLLAAALKARAVPL